MPVVKRQVVTHLCQAYATAPATRHAATSAVFTPASCSRRIAMVYFSMIHETGTNGVQASFKLYCNHNNIGVRSFILTGAPLVNKSANPDPGCFAALEVSAAALDQIAGAATLDGLIARFAC